MTNPNSGQVGTAKQSKIVRYLSLQNSAIPYFKSSERSATSLG